MSYEHLEARRRRNEKVFRQSFANCTNLSGISDLLKVAMGPGLLVRLMFISSNTENAEMRSEADAYIEQKLKFDVPVLSAVNSSSEDPNRRLTAPSNDPLLERAFLFISGGFLDEAQTLLNKLHTATSSTLHQLFICIGRATILLLRRDFDSAAKYLHIIALSPIELGFDYRLCLVMNNSMKTLRGFISMCLGNFDIASSAFTSLESLGSIDLDFVITEFGIGYYGGLCVLLSRCWQTLVICKEEHPFFQEYVQPITQITDIFEYVLDGHFTLAYNALMAMSTMLRLDAYLSSHVEKIKKCILTRFVETFLWTHTVIDLVELERLCNGPCDIDDKWLVEILRDNEKYQCSIDGVNCFVHVMDRRLSKDVPLKDSQMLCVPFKHIGATTLLSPSALGKSLASMEWSVDLTRKSRRL